MAERMRRADKKAYVVCVEIKYSDFTKMSRQAALDEPVCTGNEIYNVSCGLLDELWSGNPVRLIGIRTGKLVSRDEPEQMNLFDYMKEEKTKVQKEKMDKLEKAISEIKSKYGDKSISRASMMETKDNASHRKGEMT